MEMGRQTKEFPFEDSPFQNRVYSHLGINIYMLITICRQKPFANGNPHMQKSLPMPLDVVGYCYKLLKFAHRVSPYANFSNF
jgi:hypothetical protein